MTSVTNGLDGIISVKHGINGHMELSWSTNMKEKILQLTFQLLRSDVNELAVLEKKLDEILCELKSSMHENDTKNYLIILFKYIGYTRDIVNGKGECKLTYVMIYTWSKYYPELAISAIKCLVSHEKNKHMIGSWKDIKLFCDYCRIKQSIDKNPNYEVIINECIRLINDQLITDIGNCDKKQSISLLAKWIPREKSKYGWLFKRLALSYYSEYFNENDVCTSISSPAVRKAFTKYRQICSRLNKELDTVQIKQCGNVWKTINFNNVTSVTLAKQKNAFLNVKNKDRTICANNFKSFINEKIREGKEVNGKCIGLDYFTKQGRILLNEIKNNWSTDTQMQINMLNSQWRSSSYDDSSLTNFIPMVDMSFSMDGLPKDIAIALGIRIAEQSTLGKRIMSFCENPAWINLDLCKPDFTSMLDKVLKGNWGGSTNFYMALDLILNASIESNLSYENIQNMVLVILSDMQINKADESFKDKSLVDVIRQKYADAGVKHYGKPLCPPKIILWNLKGNNGFPCLHFYENVSMISGYSSEILSTLCNHGLSGLNKFTPWTVLNTCLKNPRYDCLEKSILEILN